jgi:hypothetical protein
MILDQSLWRLMAGIAVNGGRLSNPDSGLLIDNIDHHYQIISIYTFMD